MAFLVSDDIYRRTADLEIPWSRHGIDPFGIDRKELARFITMLTWFYRSYFKVSVNGIDHVPASGRAMIVCNHSGGVALDAAMVLASLFHEMEPPRLGQGMAEKFINKVAFASQWTARTGQLTGLPEHAVRLLEADRVLLVFPEGARGTAKLYGDRNTLVRFGTGFMRLALKTKSPIIPTAFLGGGDAIPTVMNLVRLGKLLGVPYLPVTPYLLPIPRRVDMDIYYSEPMVFEGTGDEEDAVIFEYVDQVKARIGELLEHGQQIQRGRDTEGG